MHGSLEEAWTNSYHDTYSLTALAMEAKYLCKDMETSEDYYDKICKYASQDDVLLAVYSRVNILKCY